MGNKKLINGEIIFSLLVLIVGIVWMINGIRLELWAGITPAPGLFPLAVGILLSILAVCNVIKLAAKKEDATKMDSSERKTVLLYLAGAVLCALCISFLGMMVTLIGGLVFWFLRIAHYPIKRTILLTIGIVAVIYGIFVLWLGVPFPTFFGLF